jgi:hypothetical protein
MHALLTELVSDGDSLARGLSDGRPAVELLGIGEDYKQNQTGTPALNPLFFNYPNDPNTYPIDLQFFYGVDNAALVVNCDVREVDLGRDVFTAPADRLAGALRDRCISTMASRLYRTPCRRSTSSTRMASSA